MDAAIGENRVDPPPAAPERELLAAFLDFHRQTLLWKLSGLDDEAVRSRLVPSQTTLLGMVKHLAYVERWWFQRVFAGRDVAFPWSERDPDADWRVEPGESTAEIVTLYEAETAISRRIVAELASLDEVARLPGHGHSLRWIVVHMLEETARHNGHADVLRELIDGATGE